MFYSTDPMQTKTEQKLTVHLDNEELRVTKLGSLLSFHAESGDALHVFLAPKAFDELRKLLEIATSQAADS